MPPPPEPVGPPDYVGVGAEGAGGAWWHRLLLAHPEIGAPPERSLDFFAEFCDRECESADIARYHRRFARAGATIAGEWTDCYMHDGWTPPLLRRAAPEAKLLVMLSDPIAGYRASFAERSARRAAGGRITMTDAADRRNYASQLARLRRWFDPERILVLQYERCRSDPLGQYRQTLRFLGVRDDFVPRRLSGAVRRAEALSVAALLRTPVAESVRRRALVRLTGRPDPTGAAPALWPDLETALRTTFEPELRALRELVPELEPALWPSFSGDGG